MSGFLPNMRTIPQDIRMIREFRGYNHNPVIADGEFFDQQNITADSYPLMASRAARSLVKTNTFAYDALGADHMAWIGEDGLYYNGVRVVDANMAPGGMGADWKPRLVRIGAYLCVFPHGIVYNTQTGETENIAVTKTLYASTTTGASNIVLRSVLRELDADGKPNWVIMEGTVHTDDTEPANPDDGDWWIRSSATPRTILRYSAVQQMWVSVLDVYIAIESNGIKDGFKEGDGITISGFPEEYDFLNGSFVAEDAIDKGYGMSWLIVSPSVAPTFLFFKLVNATVTISRTLPQMDYVCEMGNRLYGCSSENHEIYASKLGDPLNWNVFQGIATDSYAATVGSPGDFTGCIGYRDNVLFFKEDCIHILSGTRPATYQLNTLECNGVQRHSDKSLCIVNETLFFKGVDGFYSYSGGMPQMISMQLGDLNKATSYCAGTDGTKYYTYIGTASESGMFVYDSRRGIWVKEDECDVNNFASLGTILYAFCSNGDIWCLNAERGDIDGYNELNQPVYAWEDPVPEGTVQWSATSGALGLDSPFGKFFSGIRLRLQMEQGAVFSVSASYDESGRFQEVSRITARNTKSFNIGINVRRSDTMRIRFSGRGGFKLYSVAYVTEQGEEV